MDDHDSGRTRGVAVAIYDSKERYPRLYRVSRGGAMEFSVHRMNLKDKEFLGKKAKLMDSAAPRLPSFLHIRLEDIEAKHKKMVQTLYWAGAPVEEELTSEQVEGLVAIDEYVAAVTALAIRLAMYNGIATILGEKKKSNG